MRKLIAVAFVLSLVLPAAVMAAGNHTMAGCGLGYVLFGHGDNSRIMQILAATTNGTSGNQTFGITTGTSGCTEDGAVKFVKEVEVFAEVNLDTLRLEMAKGEGEFVESFAYLLGASDAQVPQVVKMFQDNYDYLYSTPDTTSGQMLERLGSIL
jgi:hypothetical protein